MLAAAGSSVSGPASFLFAGGIGRPDGYDKGDYVKPTVFADVTPQMRIAKDVYFDSISQIRKDTWARGRVVLIGDAAACPSLIAGEGAGLALAQAYVLAGELHRHGRDVDGAITRYQEQLKPAVVRKQKQAINLAASFIPSTALGVRARDYATLLMRLPVFPRIMMGRYFRDETELPDYEM